MLSFDLSKAIPQRFFSFLTPLIPGLFFELCVLAGNPDLVLDLKCRPHQVFEFSHPEDLAIALFLAFVIGSAFMFFISPFLQTLVGGAYLLFRFAWRNVCRWLLVPSINRLIKKPRWRGPWLANLLRYAQDKAYPFDNLDAWTGWRLLARKLLKDKFDIDIDDVGNAWTLFFWTLGKSTGEEIRGHTFAISIHATGWAGLAASLLAPALQNRYYIAFCLIMIITGLQHDWYFARVRRDPMLTAITRTRALLREYDKTTEANRTVPPV
jgi:hypothetical protein